MSRNSVCAYAPTTDTSTRVKLFAIIFALILAMGLVPGIAWAEDADSADTIEVSGDVIGLDENGYPQIWAELTDYPVAVGSTAADFTELMFEQAGLVADYDPNGEYGWYLTSITSPDNSGETLAWNDETEQYWQLFYNSEPASVGASSITLEENDRVDWYYSAYGDSLVVPSSTDESDDDESSGPTFMDVFVIVVCVIIVGLMVSVIFVERARHKKEANEEENK